MSARTGDPNANRNNAQATPTQATTEPKVDTSPKQETPVAQAPVETPKAEEPATTSGKAEDILSMIRARQQQ